MHRFAVVAAAQTGIPAGGAVVAEGRKMTGVVDTVPVGSWGSRVKGEPSAVGRNFVVVVERDTGDVCCSLPRIPDDRRRMSVSERRIEVGSQPSKAGVGDH